MAQPPVYRDSAELSEREPDAAAARARYDTLGLVLSYQSVFTRAMPDSRPEPEGRLLRVMHTGFAFRDADGPRQQFADLTASVPATYREIIAARAPNATFDRVDDLRLGDETLAWRLRTADGSASASAAWIVAVRRGAGSFILLVDGDGAAPEMMARSLARRLDERLAGALASGYP